MVIRNLWRRKMLEMLDVYAWGVAMIAALVGGVGMMNTMLMSVFERTREIGVLRAVGWRPMMVLRQVMVEAVLLTLVSGVAGLAAAAVIVWIIQAIPSAGLLRDIFVIAPSTIAQAIVVCVVLGVVGGLYPASRATRLSPVEALRYE